MQTRKLATPVIVAVVFFCAFFSAEAAQVDSTDSAQDPEKKVNHMSIRLGVAGPSDMPSHAYPRFKIDGGYSAAATLDFRLKKLGYLGATVDFTYLHSNLDDYFTQIFWGAVFKFAPSQAFQRLLVRPGVAFGQSSDYNLPNIDGHSYGHDVFQLRLLLQAAYLFTDRPGYVAEIVWVKPLKDSEASDLWNPDPYFMVRAGLTF